MEVIFKNFNQAKVCETFFENTVEDLHTFRTCSCVECVSCKWNNRVIKNELIKMAGDREKKKIQTLSMDFSSFLENVMKLNEILRTLIRRKMYSFNLILFNFKG